MKFRWVRWWWLAAACLVAHVGLLVWGVLIHYPNVDEVAHLPSGVAHWKFERFDMYRVNPPLVRMVAGLPAWLTGVDYDWSRYTERVGSRPEFAIGRARQREMGLELHRDFILPRLLCIPTSPYEAVRAEHAGFSEVAERLKQSLHCRGMNYLVMFAGDLREISGARSTRC